MEIKRFGNPVGKKIMMLHGNLMCWRQFEDVIPLLEEEFDVYAVSFDGFDGTGKTTYTTAQEQADKLEDYLIQNCDGTLDALYAESLGCGPAVYLKASKNIQIRRMILSGPEYLDFGIWNPLILRIMPQKQYQTARKCPHGRCASWGRRKQACKLCWIGYRTMSVWNPFMPHGRLDCTCTAVCRNLSRTRRWPAGMGSGRGI